MSINSKLREQVIRLCEKQYRKGLQQGAHFHSMGWMTTKQIDDFRVEGIRNSYRQMSHPLTGRKMDAIEVLTADAQMCDMQELISLLLGQEQQVKTIEHATKRQQKTTY